MCLGYPLLRNKDTIPSCFGTTQKNRQLKRLRCSCGRRPAFLASDMGSHMPRVEVPRMGTRILTHFHYPLPPQRYCMPLFGVSVRLPVLVILFEFLFVFVQRGGGILIGMYLNRTAFY